MQKDSIPHTVNPKHLILPEYPVPHVNIARPLVTNDYDVDDDIAIASGQIDLGEWDFGQAINEPSTSNGQINLYNGFSLSAELDSNGDVDFSALQTASGVGGFYGGSMPGEEGSSLVTDPEPWNHMKQTFAFPVSGPDEISSRDSQVGVLSQQSFNLLGPGVSQDSADGSDPRHHPLLETFAGYRSTQHIRAHPARPQSNKVDRVPTPSYHQPRGDYSTAHEQSRAESLISSTSSPRPFPELEIEAIQSHFSSSNPTITRHNDVSSNGKQRGFGKDVAILMDGFDELAQDLAQEPRPSCDTDGPDRLGPYGDHWWPSYSLNSVGEQLPDSRQAHDGLLDRGYYGSRQIIADGDQRNAGHECTIESGFEPEKYQLNHSNAIRIPRQPASSEHYDSHRPSSFPITAGFTPPSIVPSSIGPPTQTKPVQRRRRDTDSVLKPTTLPMQRKVSNKTARASRASSLSIVRENRQALLPASIAKGRRSGPLSKETREEASKKRAERTACIRCRMMKSRCEGDIPCEGCCKNLNARLGAHPCIKSYFLDIIEQDTCNVVFQRSISHPTLDGLGTTTVRYPSTFYVGPLIRGLQSCQSRYNIRVRPWTGGSYTVDLAHFLGLFSRILEFRSLETYELNDFMYSGVVKPSEWLGCMRDFDQSLNVLERSIMCNDMPSQNSYDLLPLDGTGSARPLDVNNERDIVDIKLAVQMNRVILRALELEAYTALQKSINELPKQKDDAAIKLLNGQLGRLLRSLRRRLAWWAMFREEPEHLHDASTNLTSRVTTLTNVLYCYFFITKKKSGTPEDRSLAQYQALDLPNDDSPAGFTAWMKRGQDLIRETLIQQALV